MCFYMFFEGPDQKPISGTKTNERNGLHDFLRILENMEEFNCVEFDIPDIVRSGFVRSYLIEKTKQGIGVDL